MSGTDDTFELFDLRVEVVIPENGAVYCGAKPGDYFELQGEMLYLRRDRDCRSTPSPPSFPCSPPSSARPMRMTG